MPKTTLLRGYADGISRPDGPWWTDCRASAARTPAELFGGAGIAEAHVAHGRLTAEVAHVIDFEGRLHTHEAERAWCALGGSVRIDNIVLYVDCPPCTCWYLPDGGFEVVSTERLSEDEAFCV